MSAESKHDDAHTDSVSDAHPVSDEQEGNIAGTTLSRRKFFGTAAAALAGLSVAPGVFLMKAAHARPLDQAASSKVRWGMLIDTNKCAKDCDACVKACNTVHGLYSLGRPETDAQWIRKVNITNENTGRSHSLPVMCQHCEYPPCVDVCPTGASFRRADGIVLVDRHICIGCRYCMMACPYKARSFVAEDLHDQKPLVPRGKGTVGGCTLCVNRVDAGNIPACAEACDKDKHNAIIFGDMKDPKSEIHKQLTAYGSTVIRRDLRLNPSIHYRGL